MPAFYGAIDLSKNELRNAVIQNLGSAPSSPSKGQIYFDSSTNLLYFYNGTAWVSASGAALGGTVTTAAIGDAPVAGVAATASASDHKHGMPAFGIAGSVETTFGSGATLGGAATLARADHAHGNPTHLATDHSTIPLSAFAAPTTFVNMASQQLINLTMPSNPGDAVPKLYVDNAIAGLSWKAPVRVASPAATNFGTMSGLIPIDGVTPNAGDRILLTAQSTPANNGIWIAAAGAWVRATDADAATEVLNMAVYVEEGTTMADTAWVCTTNAPITIGTTALTFVQFAGGGSVTAGTGMTQVGNVLNVIAGDTSLTVNADELHVNTAVIATVASVTAAVTGVAKKYAAALAGTASPEVVTHNLNTRDVQVTVLNGNSPYTAVEVDWDATSVNTVTIRYNPVLGAGYRVVVTG